MARLTVVAVYDQLGSRTLEAQLPHLDPRGALRRSIARGHYVHTSVYGYASTFTAPGHAAIHSGAPPRESGVGSNRVYLRAAHDGVSVLDDREHAILGREDGYASPRVLRAQTVADAVQEQRPESIVVSLGMKDRSAILPGGQHPDLCLWFDARAGGFTTSTWYASSLPEWVTRWQSEHRYEDLRAVPWEPADAAALEARLGPDEQSGEGAYGFNASFPHRAEGMTNRDAFLSLPASTEHLLALAEATVEELSMGSDSTPDLLAISIAATDYVGHAFGPDSWEYADVLFRSDLALGLFLDRLEAKVGPVAVVLTSDHGHARLVERLAEEGISNARRVSADRLLPELRKHVRDQLGQGDWIEEWVPPYIYLSEAARAERERVLPLVRSWLEAQPGIASALDARAIAASPVPESPEMARLLALGIPSSPPGDVFVVPQEFSVILDELDADRGTTHGSPWDYDRQVPVIAVGPGVPVSEEIAPKMQCQVAPTIGRLLGVTFERPDCPPLFEARSER